MDAWIVRWTERLCSKHEARCLTDIHHRNMPPRLQLDVKGLCWKVFPCDPFVYAPQKLRQQTRSTWVGVPREEAVQKKGICSILHSSGARGGGTNLLRFALVQDLDVLVAAYAGQTPYVCGGEVGDLIIWLLLLRWEGRGGEEEEGSTLVSAGCLLLKEGQIRGSRPRGRDPVHFQPSSNPNASGVDKGGGGGGGGWGTFKAL